MRYDQCTDDCTTDCGHCKGQGRPKHIAETTIEQPGAGTLHLHVMRTTKDFEGRTGYSYAIRHDDKPLHVGHDLWTGVNLDHGPEEMLRTLASFLSAAIESWQYAGGDGEDSGLFPRTVIEVAEQFSDEISMLSAEPECMECGRNDVVTPLDEDPYCSRHVPGRHSVTESEES